MISSYLPALDIYTKHRISSHEHTCPTKHSCTSTLPHTHKHTCACNDTHTGSPTMWEAHGPVHSETQSLFAWRTLALAVLQGPMVQQGILGFAAGLASFRTQRCHGFLVHAVVQLSVQFFTLRLGHTLLHCLHTVQRAREQGHHQGQRAWETTSQDTCDHYNQTHCRSGINPKLERNRTQKQWILYGKKPQKPTVRWWHTLRFPAFTRRTLVSFGFVSFVAICGRSGLLPV